MAYVGKYGTYDLNSRNQQTSAALSLNVVVVPERSHNVGTSEDPTPHLTPPQTDPEVSAS